MPISRFLASTSGILAHAALVILLAGAGGAAVMSSEYAVVILAISSLAAIGLMFFAAGLAVQRFPAHAVAILIGGPLLLLPLHVAAWMLLRAAPQGGFALLAAAAAVAVLGVGGVRATRRETVRLATARTTETR